MYNGVGVVPRCLQSATSLVSDDVTVMVFDDHSTSDGWSEQVEAMCAALGLEYYCTPRNLGIPRNMSLVLKTALAHGYDVAGLVNSDVVLPVNLIETMNAAFDTDPMIGSITPWSNNVSAFSLPMGGAMPSIAEADFVSRMSSALFTVQGGEVVDIPTGVGYCMMIPVEAVRAVGVMDPIFGRGYCEEVDWCQRARLAGWRNVLSLGSFVYHEGSGTNRDEGLLAHGMTTVIENELIIRGRYVDYMQRVHGFFADNMFARRGEDALARALRIIIGESGYELVIGDPGTSVGAADRAITIAASGPTDRARLTLQGLAAFIDTSALADVEQFFAEFGTPSAVHIVEPGVNGERYATWARRGDVVVTERLAYPTRV